MTNLLRARDISKSFDGEQILQGVSLAIESGDRVALMSPSGTGKSTLLSILGLLLASDTGTLEVEGWDTGGLDQAGQAHLRRQSFGFIFQHTQLIGTLRAIENVLVPARFSRKVERARLEEKLGDVRQRAQELLVALGLGNRLYHYPHQLSVGQKRRVAVARALILDPPIILADEPTNDLDAASAQVVAQTLFDLHAQGKGLLIVTHDLELARQADRIISLF
jgi:ABC-type lipoprotein export system ATPase subunit